MSVTLLFFFFFQAEDGIRDVAVTGVQTCALPIYCNALSGSPNNDAAADAEVNTLAHETEETNTDEDLDAWYDNSGNENADKCAWNFGTTYTTANGSTANMQIGTKDFLVQQNWVNANGGGCRLSW